MKISVVCKRTGLSERTIRFYVEKGEEDIDILLDISKLKEELILELKEISMRGDITWRKLASILFRNTSNHDEEKICRPLPEEMEIDENEDKTIWSHIKKGQVQSFFVY